MCVCKYIYIYKINSFTKVEVSGKECPEQARQHQNTTYPRKNGGKLQIYVFIYVYTRMFENTRLMYNTHTHTLTHALHKR